MSIVTTRTVSWNLRRRAISGVLDLLEKQGADLAMLQEVTPAAFQALRKRFAWSVYSLDLWADQSHDYPTNGHGVAVLGSEKLVRTSAYLLDHLVVPWKLLIVDVALARQRGYFTAASYHALHGEQGPDGLDKPRLTLQVADWLERQPQPVVLGMDANSPAVDPPDLSDVECHFQWLGPGGFERRLLAPEARHRLRDTFRTFLAAHPDVQDRLRRERPRGPLAVSYKTRGVNGEYRYDHIYATWPDFRVIDVRYLYDEAREAGSDHALVVADLAANAGTGKPGTAGALLPTALLRHVNGAGTSTDSRMPEPSA